MDSTRRGAVLWVASILVGFAGPAIGQPLGTFRWQMQPYCNVITVAVNQDGAIYTLAGTDDQCSASGPRTGVSGIAFVNPDGQIGLALNLVGAPGGSPDHVDATVSLASLSGSWRDSAGTSGAFTFTPAASTGGSVRPLAGVGGAAVNPAQVQLRVSGSCSPGQSMVGINQNGTVSCVTPAGGGGITGVLAGTGLTGGGTAGDVTLNVSFLGTGASTSAARSDHTHGTPGLGVRVGESALIQQTTGQFNTAVGHQALFGLTTGSENTGVGYRALGTGGGNHNTGVGSGALQSNASGTGNVAVGWGALPGLASGDANVAIGDSPLYNTTAGGSNIAIGYHALTFLNNSFSNVAIGTGAFQNMTSGNYNIALGLNAGINASSGTNNMYLGNEGVASETSTIRLGSGVSHTRLFLAAARGVTTGVNNAVPLLIDSLGQVGTISSSRRYKEDIAALGDSTSPQVQRLRPVTFRYLKPFDDGTKPIQYGLIAEEVEAVMPDLVVHNDDGQPETVKYQLLPTLLLAEVQRLERERAAQEQAITELRRQLDALRTELARPR